MCWVALCVWPLYGVPFKQLLRINDALFQRHRPGRLGRLKQTVCPSSMLRISLAAMISEAR
jgi:hypothetical protein